MNIIFLLYYAKTRFPMLQLLYSIPPFGIIAKLLKDYIHFFLKEKMEGGLRSATFWDITQHTVAIQPNAPCNNPEKRRSHPLHAESLKSQEEAFPKINIYTVWIRKTN